jgi:hypothetical protein
MAEESFDIEAEHCTWIAEKEYTRDLRLACAATNAAKPGRTHRTDGEFDLGRPRCIATANAV